MARVNVNGRIVNVFSTHLDHQSSATRLSQVRQLVAWADNHAEQRIIAGDFNGWPGTAGDQRDAQDPQRRMGRRQEQGRGRVLSRATRTATRGTPASTTSDSSKGATALVVTRAEVFDTRDSAGQKPSDHNPLIVTFQVR